MTVRLLDGFDRYGDLSNTALNKFWTPSAANSNAVALSTGGKFGAGAVRLRSTASIKSQTFATNLNMLSPTRFAFWLYVDNLPTTPSLNQIITFTSSSTTQKAYLQLSTSGQLFMRAWGLGSSGSLVFETDPVITAGAWHHVEIDILFSTTAADNFGICWVDDILQVSENQAVFVYPTDEGITTVDSITFHASPSTGDTIWDDILLWQYSPDNPFFLAGATTPLGSHRINTYSPIGDGAVTTGVPTGASAAWIAVADPIEQDGDTTYIKDLGQSQFRMPDMISVPYALAVNAVSKRANVTTTKMQLLLNDPTGDQLADEVGVTAGYVRYQGIFPRNAAGDTWGLPPVEIGLTVTLDEVQTTQMFLEELNAADGQAALFAEIPGVISQGYTPRMVEVL